MLIDWLTLRYPITLQLGVELHDRISAAMGRMVKINASGEVEWEKSHVDWNDIRSDSSGLYWNITADADSVRYLTIGASPSSLEHAGVNVFGSMQLQRCAKVLIVHASKALGAILPDWLQWQCRRMDITANYDMGNAGQVKQALRLLLATDAPRRKANSDRRGGDTVYWNPTSDLVSGKAYHKGAHLRFQKRKGNIELDEEILQLADNLLRLEMRLGARWFRRLEKDWHGLTEKELAAYHFNFFKSLIGGGDVEVSDMGTLLIELEKVCPTKGKALAVHATWSVIKTMGYSQTQATMTRSRFYDHCKYLRAAGISSADLCAGVVIPFRRKSLVLGEPVTSWDELRRAA